MPKIRYQKRFEKPYVKLPSSTRKKVDKALRLLAENPRHPSLHTKPIKGADGIYEARVDRNYRMTFEHLPGDILLLRVVGKYDETLKSP
jgi:mRNA-degrading endonuclease RelE of RelBE toxin-antitoxin system